MPRSLNLPVLWAQVTDCLAARPKLAAAQKSGAASRHARPPMRISRFSGLLRHSRRRCTSWTRSSVAISAQGHGRRAQGAGSRRRGGAARGATGGRAQLRRSAASFFLREGQFVLPFSSQPGLQQQGCSAGHASTPSTAGAPGAVGGSPHPRPSPPVAPPTPCPGPRSLLPPAPARQTAGGRNCATCPTGPAASWLRGVSEGGSRVWKAGWGRSRVLLTRLAMLCLLCLTSCSSLVGALLAVFQCIGPPLLRFSPASPRPCLPPSWPVRLLRHRAPRREQPSPAARSYEQSHLLQRRHRQVGGGQGRQGGGGGEGGRRCGPRGRLGAEAGAAWDGRGGAPAACCAHKVQTLARALRPGGADRAVPAH